MSEMLPLSVAAYDIPAATVCVGSLQITDRYSVSNFDFIMPRVKVGQVFSLLPVSFLLFNL